MTEIVQHLRSEGFEVDGFTPDGNIHRIKPSPDDNKKSAWYCGYQNHTRDGQLFYLVVYGDWRKNESPKKFHTLKGKVSPEDKKYIKEQSDKATEKSKKDKLDQHEEVAKEVQTLWDSLSQEGKSPYLDKKQITVCPNMGIRFNTFAEDIYVDARDENGKLWSLERIAFNGTKRFHPGGRIAGCHHVIGELTQDTIYFTEGFSTGCSIALATGCGVVCCFSASNIEANVDTFKKHYPDARIIICGDDDRLGDNNVGRNTADRVAKLFGAIAIYPKFKNEKSLGTDFNDLHCEEGLEEVKYQLAPEALPVSAETFNTHYIVNSPYPDENEKTMTRKGTKENIEELLRRLKVVVRYNVMSKNEEILIPHHSYSMDNYANATYSDIVSWCERVKIPTGNLQGYLTNIADKNQYHPVATWIDSKPWDGVPRLEHIYGTIKAKREREDSMVMMLKSLVMKKWMISCVAAIYEPNGISAHGVLVLQGNQYLGKTAWFKSLAPKDLECIKDGITLKVDNKDSVFQVVSKWIVELGEISGTFNKSELNHLKAFITMNSDELRRPYAKKESKYARRTIFGASENDQEFLMDQTGNRRFWAIACESINYDHGLDMQQIWAEIKDCYKNGHKWVLSAEELKELNRQNEQFTSVHPIEEMIRSYCDWDQPVAGLFQKLSATELLKEIGIDNPNQGHKNVAGRALRKLSKHHSVILDGFTKYLIPYPKK